MIFVIGFDRQILYACTKGGGQKWTPAEKGEWEDKMWQKCANVFYGCLPCVWNL